MARMTPLLILLAGLAGCTSTKLRTSTVNQVGTLTELQYQQVLNNLAMFCTNPEHLPSLANLKDGSCQIADLGSASYVGDWHRAFASHPSVLGSRTVVQQWGMSPVTDDDELELLQLAYGRAVGVDRSLEDKRELANDLAHELVKQLPEVDDYRGSIVNQYEDYRNRVRNDKLALAPATPLNLPDIRLILSTIYPVAVNNRSIAKDFANETISCVDNKIVYDNEILRYLNIYCHYNDVVSCRGRAFYTNYKDYTDDPRPKPSMWWSAANPSGVFYAESDGAAINGSLVAYVTPEAAAVRRQIREIENDLLSIPCDRRWYGCGRKHDVPRDACFVGHYGDCYVWVCQGGVKELANLTLKTLKFSSLIKDDAVLTVPGPRYTPSSGFPSL